MPTDPSPIGAAQVRIARPTKYLAAPKSLYVAVDAVGFGVLAQWVDHEGYDGVVLSIGDATRQLELLQQPGVTPTPTSEDQIVLYLGCTQTVAGMAEPIQAAGHQPVRSPNPHWERDGAKCFVDPDGYWFILSPSHWGELSLHSSGKFHRSDTRF